jgi:hypothetical protein
MAWDLVEHGKHIHEIRFPEITAEWEKYVLIQGDEHWDNPMCDRDLLKRHHEQAVERDAIILKFGDIYCAMQGKYDPRSCKDDVREEHAYGNYLDTLVDTAIDWYKPYSKQIALLTLGNHETSILKRHETNLLERLAAGLRKNGSQTRVGGYRGWVRFQFNQPNSRSESKRLYYVHGWGGGGPVTKGKIQFNRLAEYVEADYLVAGHVHWKECFPVPRVSLGERNTESIKEVLMIRVGTYKDEFAKPFGFHVERGQGPRPMGGYWLRFYYKNKQIRHEIVSTEQ